MADLKISALTSAGALAGTEPLPIVQGGSTKKTTAQDIANLKASWDSTLVSTSLTAVLSTQYVVVASATFTDPSPVEGKGFQVYVRNGTATIGGVGYSVAGSVIWRVFHSGAWATYFQSAFNDATSSIQTQLNSKITFFASGADGTASSGTSNTISISVLIPANTFALDDVIRINHRVRATGTTATRETRIYVNTSASLTGATVVSTASLTNTVLAANMQRFLAIKNATTNTEVITATTNLLTDYNNLTTAVSTLLIDWTVNQYIIFAVNAINAADSIRATMYSIEKL
jgi:hypothetical protein